MAWSDRWSRAFLPGLRYYVLALTFFVVTFALVPFTIYAHSGEDWGFAFSWLLRVAALGLVLFTGVAVLIRFVAALHGPAASTVAVALFCLGVFLLLAHVYAPIEIGPLDGSAIKSAESGLRSIIEFVLLASAIYLFVQLQGGRGLNVATLFAVGLALVAAGYAGFLAAAGETTEVAQAAPAASASTSAVSSTATDGNIYHIVLDRMQTGAFLQVLERAGAADAFHGFELFKNNVANYLRTTQSAASYFTGTYFNGDDYKSWIWRWHKHEGMLSTLAEQNYRLWMYAPIENWKSHFIDIFRYNVDIYEQETGLASAGLYDLLHIWLVSLVPNPLTNEALAPAQPWVNRTFELLTGRLRPLSGQEGLHAYASVMMLRRMVREEAGRRPNGEYVYAHALLPHGPLVLDRSCAYVGPRRQRAERLKTIEQAYLVQAECALGLIVSFLQELERRGRREAATILIHGDTGTWIALDDTKKRRGRILGRRVRSVISYAQALLMIKRPQAEGPLRVVETPTQLVDLYPTLLDVLDLSPPATKLDGRSIYSKDAAKPRPTYVVFDPNAKLSLGRDLIKVRINDPYDLPNSKLTVIGPVAGSTFQRVEPNGE